MITDDEELLVGLVKVLSDRIHKDIEKSLPCVVTKVTSREKVTVRPLIRFVDRNEESYDRDIIEGLPVYTAGAHNVLISFPVKVGDLGWIDASDRDISLFLQSYEPSEPPTRRMHSFSDARFVPDIMTNFTIASEDDDAVVMQTRDGSVKIALDENEIRVKNGPVDVTVTNSSVTGVAPGGFDLNGFTISSDGTAESPTQIITPSAVVNGKEMDGHDHGPGTYNIGGTPVTGDSGGNN